MAKNLLQVYTANPVSTINNNDLMYVVVAGTTDGGINGGDLKALFASSTLTSAEIYIGNGSNVATGVAMSGDGTISNTGAITISKIGGMSISLSGSFTTLGAFSAAFTFTGSTGVTFPTSGTLATTSQIPSFPLSPANGGTGENNGTNTLTVNANSTINQDVSTTGTPTFSSVTLTSGTIADAPVNPTDITNKAYVDSVAAGGGLVPVNVTSSPITLAPGKAYFVNNGASEVTFNLPAPAAFGDNYAIYGFSSGGYQIVGVGGQVIHIGNISGTTLTSNNQYDAVNLYCMTASTVWVGNVLQGDPNLA